MSSKLHSQAIVGLAASGAAVEADHPEVVISDSDNPRISRKKQPERRSDRRYDLRLDCELYRLTGPHMRVRAGAGKTAVWSRCRILIQTDVPLSEGECVQVVSHWMFGLQLVVCGRVIRRDTRGIALEIKRPRFQGNAADFWNREVKALAGRRKFCSDLEVTHRA